MLELKLVCHLPHAEQQKSVIEMYGQYIIYTMHAAVAKWSQTLPPTPKMK